MPKLKPRDKPPDSPGGGKPPKPDKTTRAFVAYALVQLPGSGNVEPEPPDPPDPQPDKPALVVSWLRLSEKT